MGPIIDYNDNHHKIHALTAAMVAGVATASNNIVICERQL
jgi:hypothetical protein